MWKSHTFIHFCITFLYESEASYFVLFTTNKNTNADLKTTQMTKCYKRISIKQKDRRDNKKAAMIKPGRPDLSSAWAIHFVLGLDYKISSLTTKETAMNHPDYDMDVIMYRHCISLKFITLHKVAVMVFQTMIKQQEKITFCILFWNSKKISILLLTPGISNEDGKFATKKRRTGKKGV